MKDFIESLITTLENPELNEEQRELFENLLRSQAQLEQELLDKINTYLKK